MKDSHAASPILEHSSLTLNLVLDADAVLVVHRLPLAAVPHAVVRLHLEVEFGVAVHHAAFLYEALEGADFHGQPKGFV